VFAKDYLKQVLKDNKTALNILRLLDDSEEIMYFGLIVGPNLETLCKKAVAAIDTEVFEDARKVRQSIKDDIDRAIQPNSPGRKRVVKY
jgi:hypothetical protein